MSCQSILDKGFPYRDGPIGEIEKDGAYSSSMIVS